jgi:class 3 adenylate cyclase
MAEAHRLAGERSRAVLAAREAVKLDELREASYRLLMETLAAAGERAEALRVWERCRVMLAEELGVDPSPETESVYLSLLRDEPSPPRPTLPTGVVTFLLTDIVDSTGHWERNPAAMGAALERHDRLVSETVTAHGGSLLKSKLEGDATVSVFPRTSAGAAAAVALQAVLAAEPWPKEVELAVRMALHTGEAVERDGDYFGPALNRAARLRALAGGGQIVVSQAVAEVVRDHLPEGTALRSLGERQLRGSTRSEHVHELVPNATLDDNAETASLVGRPPFPAILHSPAAFVGRGAELERLSTEWANATAGAARAVLVGGEPGVGKTRLAGQWAGAVWDQGALVLYGRCDEELGAPYQPFAEALRALLPHTRPGWLRALRGVEELARPGLAHPIRSGHRALPPL